MADSADGQTLGDLLVTRGTLSPEQLTACLELQRQMGDAESSDLAKIVVDQGYASQADIQETLKGVPPLHVLVGELGGHDRAPSDSAECVARGVPSGGPGDVQRIGRYLVTDVLGRGGMGVVYRGHDPRLGRDVAIKMILSDRAGPEDLARFEREARAAARIRHPGFVAIHEVDEYQGRPFLVMDLVEGETLEDLLARESASPRWLADKVAEVAAALHHAHERGIVHRDVKPQNIMVDADGRPLVMDFGLVQDSSAKEQLTQTGEVLGTPAYMAPEQVDVGELGPWTDVYALGSIIYRGLVGQLPFQANNPAAQFRMILFDEPEAPRSLVDGLCLDLETIVLKCMAKEPGDRYPSAVALARDLRRYLAGEAILARRLNAGERAVRWVRRNPTLAGALAVAWVVLLTSVAGGLSMYWSHQGQLQRAQEEAAGREEGARIEAAVASARLEERLRLEAEVEAREREQQAALEATRLERERSVAAELETLRREVEAILVRVRSGDALVDAVARRAALAKLLEHRQPETVSLVTQELDALSAKLQERGTLDQRQVVALHFLCESLQSLGIREGAVEALGRYLEAELQLPESVSRQLRAVPAGKALCLLGCEEADAILVAARDGFGRGRSFWRGVRPLYGRTGVDVVAEEESADSISRSGVRRFEKGDFGGAIEEFSRALELDETHVEAWTFRARARFKKRDYQGAVADYTRASELVPEDVSIWSGRAVANYLRGDGPGALRDLSRAVDLDPRDVGLLTNRGTMRREMGDLAGAIADFTTAIEIYPSLATAWSQRGLAKASGGDFDGAMEDFAKAIDLDPTDSEPWANMGVVRHQRGDVAGAIADYSQALLLKADHLMALSNRGNARVSDGDLLGAIQDFEQFLQRAPGHPLTPGLRAQIKNLREQLRAPAAEDR